VVRYGWHGKGVVRSIDEISDAELGGEFVDRLGRRPARRVLSPQARLLGHTITRWRDQIVARHQALVSNGPTEAVNKLIKHIKSIGSRFRRFAHYRIRLPYYAGKPNGDLLPTVTPR
jgi:transposase